MKTWLISGASGLLGHALCKLLIERGDRVVGICNHHQVLVDGVEVVGLDIVQEQSRIPYVVKEISPDVVVHAAGITNVDMCEVDVSLARAVHAEAAELFAQAAKTLNAQMIYISTDQLWDGTRSCVDECEPPNPMNVYAQTKLEGELIAASAYSRSLIARVNFYGPGLVWRQSFSDWIVNALMAGEKITVFSDAYYTPISLWHLCVSLLELVENEATGIYHVASRERISKLEFAMALADRFRLDKTLIKSGRLADAKLKAPRPLDMSLSVAKIEKFLDHRMPTLAQCLQSL